MKTEKQRVSQAFGRGSDAVVLDTAGAVHANLYGNPSFPTPPVSAVVLEGAITAMTSAIAAQAQGGTAATAEKNNRKSALATLLQSLAFYVQVESANDLAKLLSSGFTAVSVSRAQNQLPQPTGLKLDNGLTGQLLLTVERVANARCYEIEVALLDEEGKPGSWMNAGLSTRSRNMQVGGLELGKLYACQTRAVGGSTGYSDWSDPVVRRVM